jgi:hypothetical protein
MKEEIHSFMELYNYLPTLMLFENLLADGDYLRKKENVSRILELSEEAKLNPIDVVLESLVNVVSEDISRQRLTHSTDKILINSDIRNTAVDRILTFVDNDERKLRELHKAWLNRLKMFMKQLYQRDKNMKIEETIFRVSNQFRIAGLSAITAIASVSK